MFPLRCGLLPVLRVMRGAAIATLLALPQAQHAAAEEPLGSIRVVQTQVRIIDGVVVDVDASALRDSSNLRLAVMPAGAPDAITDTSAFADNSTRINAGRVRLTLPGGPPGQDEVRLYHIPRFSAAFVVAVRAPITVAPGVVGAVIARDLGRQAARLGPVRFEAQYRDTPVLVQAQFLRVRPETEWDVRWFKGVPLDEIARHLAVISLGTRGVVPDRSGSTNEVLCIMATDAGPALQRIATLNPGDAVLVQGNPTTWSAAAASDPVLLRGCRFAA